MINHDKLLEDGYINEQLVDVYKELSHSSAQQLAYLVGHIDSYIHNQDRTIKCLKEDIENIKDEHRNEVVALEDEIHRLKNEVNQKHSGGRKSQYSDDFKQEILSYLANHTYKQTAEQYNVSTSTLQSWLKQK